MRRTLVLALVAAAALAGSPAGAQSIPNITAAKSAATNAANAANAHTAAVNATASEKPAASKPAPAKPAASKPVAQPAKPQPTRAQPAKSEAKPDARATTKADAKTDAKADAKAAAKPAPVAEKPDTQAAGRDSARTIKVGAATSVATRGAASELTFSREVYSYPGHGRRDPFMSLLKSGDLRPLLSDLKLVTVLYDPTGRNSVAILRDLSTKPADQYRVKLGQQLGRMRVAQIQPKQIVLTIEEFGYNRQETLALTSDSTRTR